MENRKGIPALRIREIRLKAGLSQNALAKKAGVSQSHISEIESGEKKVGLAIALKLTEALNCTIDDILRLEDEPNQFEYVPEESGQQ